MSDAMRPFAPPPQLARLWLVRHGESAGNVARELAEASGAAAIEIEGRDIDVPLSARGETQAAALARWSAHLPTDERPTRIMTSPFARAVRTAEIVRDALGVPCALDERLREKEFGSLNRLTRAGVRARFPHEVEQRTQIGKFYYRPPAARAGATSRSACAACSITYGYFIRR